MIKTIRTYSKTTFDTSEYIVVADMRKVDYNKYRKNKVSWDTVDGHEAKIVHPRRTGIGTTGVYIDSVSIWKEDVNGLNLYGENLKPTNQQALLAAIKTLKFKLKNDTAHNK